MSNFEKKYIGNAKPGKFDGQLSITINADSVDWEKDSFYGRNGNQYLNFTVAPLMKGKDLYGNTHSVFILHKKEEESM